MKGLYFECDRFFYYNYTATGRFSDRDDSSGEAG